MCRILSQTSFLANAYKQQYGSYGNAHFDRSIAQVGIIIVVFSVKLKLEEGQPIADLFPTSCSQPAQDEVSLPDYGISFLYSMSNANY